VKKGLENFMEDDAEIDSVVERGRDWSLQL
jgi:hypothetical protein